jgi:hypothetical protein
MGRQPQARPSLVARPRFCAANSTRSNAQGEYRVFGLNINHAKTAHQNLSVKVEQKTETVIVQESTSGEVVAQLKYECFSGDWAFASFSDDGNVIAVIEPYYVTFFARAGADV